MADEDLELSRKSGWKLGLPDFGEFIALIAHPGGPEVGTPPRFNEGGASSS